jgi:hypothetical protein
MSAKERFIAPPIVFLLYMAAAFAMILGYRYFFPGAAEPLQKFFFHWRLITAYIDFTSLYPVLAFSALVIPFGLKEHSEGGYAGGTFVGNKGFAPQFLQYLTWPVITAALAAVLYALLFFVVLPFAGNAQLAMTARGELYHSSLAKAKECAAEGEWAEASRFFAIAEGIWRENREIIEFRKKFDSEFSAYRIRVEESKNLLPAPETPGQPVTAVQAMAMAEKAFEEERWYDAHWLATLAVRLARSGSAERAPAQALASRAWNKISALEPNAQERERYANYRLKQDGYIAMQANDWINAYYIFQELSVRTPADPDIERYLKESAKGVADIAFFLDEIELALGSVLHNPVFSLPMTLPDFDTERDEENIPNTGRMVLRCSAILLLPDYAYAWNPELVAVDANGVFRYRVQAEYGKIVPVAIGTAEGRAREQSALLLRALDRTDGTKRWEPVWTGESGKPLESPDDSLFSGGSQVLLNVGYEDLLLLARTRQGIDSLNLRDLFEAKRKLAYYGYAPVVFRVEILRRLAEPVLFLPLAILVLIFGWRYRARRKPRYVYLPMLGALPLVFSGAVLWYRGVLGSLLIRLSLSFGFEAMLAGFIAGSVLCFVLALIFLAAQHG